MKHSQKMFLSPSEEEFGTLCYHVVTPKDKESLPDYLKPSVDCELRITDCNQSATLEFSFESTKGYHKRITKLNKMIMALQQMRAEMALCHGDMLRLQGKIDEPSQVTVERDSVREDLAEAASRHNFTDDAFMEVNSGN